MHFLGKKWRKWGRIDGESLLKLFFIKINKGKCGNSVAISKIIMEGKNELSIKSLV